MDRGDLPELLDMRPGASFFLPSERRTLVVTAAIGTRFVLRSNASSEWEMTHTQSNGTEELELNGVAPNAGDVHVVKWSTDSAGGGRRQGVVVVAVARSEEWLQGVQAVRVMYNQRGDPAPDSDASVMLP